MNPLESTHQDSIGSQEENEQPSELKEEYMGYDPALVEKLRRQIDISRRANH